MKIDIMTAIFYMAIGGIIVFNIMIVIQINTLENLKKIFRRDI